MVRLIFFFILRPRLKLLYDVDRKRGKMQAAGWPVFGVRMRDRLVLWICWWRGHGFGDVPQLRRRLQGRRRSRESPEFGFGLQFRFHVLRGGPGERSNSYEMNAPGG